MLQSILYGNGINRLTKGMPSWDQLIREISDGELEDKIPNPLKYEALLMKQPYKGPHQRLITSDGLSLVDRDGNAIYADGELTEKVLKERIAKRLKQFSSNSIYDQVSRLPITLFITTNYDNTIFKSLGTASLNKRFREEKLYSIRRNYVINAADGEVQYYWPMHGNIDSPASIMLGFDHYCGSLAKIEQYVKGGYDLHGSRLESMSKRINQGINEVISWVDLFFVSDIHIIGLNLGYEEIDLWWVLNKRRRIKQADSDLVKNRICYYPVENIKDGIQQVLASFDVEVVSLDDNSLTRSFLSRYNTQMGVLHQRVQEASVR